MIIAIMLVVSCSGGEIAIKNSEANNEIKEASIKTTKVVSEEPEEIKLSPELNIISPAESQLIRNSTVIVSLQAVNFNIVPIGVPVKENEGHFHVWLDSEKKVTTESVSTFENVGSGRHSIVAELVKSDHSSLSPKIIKSVNFNVESIAEPVSTDSDIGEYTIEADDRGFYPNKIMSKIGNNVTISFKFRDALIYYAGLDVIGPFPDVRYNIGDEQPISRSFIMLEETKIKSFWPSTGVKKAELIVEVEK
ncbi:hypothetical protein HYX06_01095 [Candidatus Woesearchaeota archaeon]|nr:hypothetical protein [Candidatus Woesearchaeota archaeon]